MKKKKEDEEEEENKKKNLLERTLKIVSSDPLFYRTRYFRRA